MTAFSYDATVTPNPTTLSATLAVAVTGSGSTAALNLQATAALPAFQVDLTPTGNVAQWILSAIALPLLETLQLLFLPLLQVFEESSPMTLKTISAQTIPLTESDSIVVTPAQVTLSGAGGYATLSGTLTVS